MTSNYDGATLIVFVKLKGSNSLFWRKNYRGKKKIIYKKLKKNDVPPNIWLSVDITLKFNYWMFRRVSLWNNQDEIQDPLSLYYRKITWLIFLSSDLRESSHIHVSKNIFKFLLHKSFDRCIYIPFVEMYIYIPFVEMYIYTRLCIWKF